MPHQDHRIIATRSTETQLKMLFALQVQRQILNGFGRSSMTLSGSAAEVVEDLLQLACIVAIVCIIERISNRMLLQNVLGSINPKFC